MNALMSEFKAMAITSFGDTGDGAIQLAKRPDQGGTAGRKIPLSVNLYRLKFRSSASIAHYDVNIVPIRAKEDPSKPAAAVNREISIAVWDALVAAEPELRTAAFDSRKNAFTLGRVSSIPNGSKVYRVELDPETPARPARLFDVKLQLAQVIDLSILDKYCRHEKAANMSDLAATAIMALDVLLRHSMYRRNEFVVGAAGRKFLNTKASTPLGEGGQVLAGLFQSVRPTVSGIVLNADTAFSPYIITGKLLDVCNAIVGRAQTGAAQGGGGRGGRGGFRGGRGGGRGGFGGSAPLPSPVAPFRDLELHHLKRKLKNAKVRVTHREDKRAFGIIGFGQPAGRQLVHIADKSKKTGGAGGKNGKKGAAAKPTPKEAAEAAARGEQLSFEREKAQQKTMTVVEYFQQTYNRKVNPDLQCVELRGGQFVPIECLELLQGAAIPPTQLSATQAAAMINVSAKPPAERRIAIDAIRKDADVGPGSRAAARGIEVEPQMMKIQGRLLQPPRVQYHQQSRVQNPNVANGAWNLKDSRFLLPGASLKHWAVVVFADQRFASPQAVEAFFSRLIFQLKQRGMLVGFEKPRIYWWDGREDKLNALKRGAGLVMQDKANNPSGAPPQMLFCILQDPKTYDDIKRKAAFDLPVAMPTQVMLLKKVLDQRGVDQYAGNVAMTINAKLNGINSALSAADSVPPKTLLLGADVTHPTGLGSPRAGSTEGLLPSIAALVGAMDGTNMRYSAQVREQEPRKEFITDLENMAVVLVEKYNASCNKVKPERVIMFRDGVSEGQLAPIVHAEVTALKAAFRRVDPKWNPKLTYVVCAKRHHVRLFSANNDQNDVDRTGNLKPGVVVDTAITHPYAFDFYLQSQAGLKGTAKPTRYIVLLDENKFGSDQLQKMINSLCYSFARATRSVSLVPVAYYADIVCTKARSFMTDDDASTTTSAVARANNRPRDYIQQKLDRGKVLKDAMGQGMWFI
ncbi:argonaute/piwi family protein [Rhodotorula paludigena]|uniref:argonaute/piwi family protein n=1 Tax=Rhodotorula paludigena TaxID=86838 RepID=UPI00316EFC2F